MGVEDKYPGYTYHSYKENHPVHQFNSGKTNSHVRINGTVYIDDGSGPVPIEVDDYDKLNNDTFQNSMTPGLPSPFYLRDLDYNGEHPTTSNEYKAANKLLSLVSEKSTMPCTWSLGGADEERIVFVEPTREGSNKIKFNLGGYVYTMEVLSDKVITTTKLIDEGSDDYDKLNDDIFQEFASSYGLPTPFYISSLDLDNKHPSTSNEYKIAKAIMNKILNDGSLKCTWSVSGDDDESVIFVTPTLTDDCVKFTLGGNLYSMKLLNDTSEVECTTAPINYYRDNDEFVDASFQEFASTFGYTTDLYLKDLNYNSDYIPASKEYKFADSLITTLSGTNTLKCTWKIDDEEYVFVKPTKYDTNVVAFTVGGTLYKFTKNSDGSKIIFSNEPINKASDDYDVFVDQEFKDLIDTVGVTLPHGLIDLNFDTTANVFSDEYKVADLIIDILKAGDPVRCTWSVKLPDNKEYIFVDPTLYDDNTIHFVYGGNLYEMVTNPTTGVVTKTYPIKDSFKHESDDWMSAYTTLTTTAPELRTYASTGSYDSNTNQYNLLYNIYNACYNGGPLKVLYCYTTYGGKVERLFADATTTYNDTLEITFGSDVIRCHFTTESGSDVVHVVTYCNATQNELYNTWFQKEIYGISNSDHDDQFFIVDKILTGNTYWYGSPEYIYVEKLINKLGTSDKCLKIPVSLDKTDPISHEIVYVDSLKYLNDNTYIGWMSGKGYSFNYNDELYTLMYGEYMLVDMIKRNKNWDNDDRVYGYINAMFPNKCSLSMIRFNKSTFGNPTLITATGEKNVANNLLTYDNMVGATLGCGPDSGFKFPLQRYNVPAASASLNENYDITDLPELVIVKSSANDSYTEVYYDWTFADVTYHLKYDVDNDKWYKWYTMPGGTILYDSESYNRWFQTKVLNNTGEDQYVKDYAISTYMRPSHKGFNFWYNINNYFGMTGKTLMIAPWDKSSNNEGSQRYDLCTIVPIRGYDELGTPHGGLRIVGPDYDYTIDYCVNDAGTDQYYYRGTYNRRLRETIELVVKRNDSNYLPALYARDLASTNDSPFLGSILQAEPYVNLTTYRLEDPTRPQFIRVQKIFRGLIKSVIWQGSTTWPREGTLIPWDMDMGYDNTSLQRNLATFAYVVALGKQTPKREVQNFIVTPEGQTGKYLVRFNGPVDTATRIDVTYFDLGNTLVEAIATKNYTDSCYEAGLAKHASHGTTFCEQWYPIGHQTWKYESAGKLTLTGDILQKAQGLSLAYKKWSDVFPVVDPLFYNRIFPVPYSGFVSDQVPTESGYLIFVYVKSMDKEGTRFKFEFGGEIYHIELDAPGLSATTGTAWIEG